MLSLGALFGAGLVPPARSDYILSLPTSLRVSFGELSDSQWHVRVEVGPKADFLTTSAQASYNDRRSW